ILVDCKLRPLKSIVERGNKTHQIEIPIRNIVKEALDLKAYGLIFVHNHPSGEVLPSQADIAATELLNQTLLSLDILLLDHIIVSLENYYSMHEHGLLSMENEYSVLGDTLEKIPL
ncbi:MAG: hypothetical protein K2O22_01105, partial [Anaeroplasmataceae bacterium]|nr:hypothetical protein [Anaeroplasmataceae bacterium]